MAELTLLDLDFGSDDVRRWADAHGVYYVVRVQHSWNWYIDVCNGKTERVTYNITKGAGIQAFTSDGLSGFAASDRLDGAELESMATTSAALARASDVIGVKRNKDIFEIGALQARHPLPEDYQGDQLDVAALERELLAMNEGLRRLGESVSIRSIWGTACDEWRILRSDGTDVCFAIPRSRIIHIVSAHGQGRAASAFATVAAHDPALLLSEERREILQRRGQQAVERASGLLTAPRLSGGHYKLVMDYELAMVLAHEAFGHAAETDHVEHSILGREGRFATGMQVAADSVTIIDGPIWGDYAYQPYSANGVRRETVTVVENGVLKEALADVFSARRAGVRVTGAGRAQSYEHMPVPRMTNIRIKVEGARRYEIPLEETTPTGLYEALLEEGLAAPDEEIIYLSGAMGGQVNPKTGDFVFNCNGVYRLREEGRLYGATSFSGQILSALKAIRGALGPVCTESPGTCGKAGQSVPSSGGANLFVVMDQDENVTIGGEQ